MLERVHVVIQMLILFSDKESVERRLSNLGSPSVVHQCETCS